MARPLIAMRYGDHSWLHGLEKRPDLNGHRVTLREWHEERQRWQCEPVGWTHTEPYVAVRPKHLSANPVPRWTLAIASEAAVSAGDPLTPNNTKIECVNAADFRECGIEVPSPPSWQEVVASRQETERVRAKLGAVDNGAQHASRIEALMHREGELRRVLAGDTDHNPGFEDRMRHMLCQKALIEAQIQLLKARGHVGMLHQAEQMLREHTERMAPMQKAWDDEGEPALDFWENTEEDPEEDAELKKWCARRRR
jgi:hypothetical protein